MNKIKVFGTVAIACVAVAVGAVTIVKFNNDDNVIPTVVDILPVETTEPVNLAPTLPDEWWTMYEQLNPSPIGMTAKARDWQHLNNDMVAWITIPDTPLDEPVLLDPGAAPDGSYGTNEYYLYKNLDLTYSRAGTVFMDYRNVFGDSEDMQSNNIILHGHNMRDDSMFGSFTYYRKGGKDYYDEHPIICLSSNYRDYQYIIFGMAILSGYADTDFRYWDMPELYTEEDFNAYVEKFTGSGMLDSGVDVQFGDKLLTMSTCVDDLRFVMVARRLRENETSIDNIDRTQAYIDAKLQAEAEEKAKAESEAKEKSETETKSDEENE